MISVVVSVNNYDPLTTVCGVASSTKPKGLTGWQPDAHADMMMPTVGNSSVVQSVISAFGSRGRTGQAVVGGSFVNNMGEQWKRMMIEILVRCS